MDAIRGYLMQTFLPSSNFSESMRVLDNSRLGNQVYREGMTLLRGGWPNHPASKMWRGYEAALVQYLMTGVKELFNRGKDYSSRPWAIELESMQGDVVLPPWLGNKEFHDSHKSNLLRKDPIWYGQWDWDVPDNLEYVWPEPSSLSLNEVKGERGWR